VDPDIVYFAGNSHLYKSDDGGGTWSDVLSGDVEDVLIDPNVPDILYVAVRGQGILKTDNAGSTWTPKGDGVTFSVLDDNGTAQDSALNGGFRIRLAMGEDPGAGRHGTRFIVAKVQGTILTSPDGADTWRILPGMDHGFDNQNWWDSCVAVCPSDEAFIVAGGGRVQFTLDADSPNPTWQPLPDSLHEDQQAIAFAPSNPNDFYFSNDGYVGLARNRGASSSKVSDGLVASQCFNVAVSQGPALVAGCSTYHTGTIRTGRSVFLQWEAIDGPEGGLFEIDSSDEGTMFGSPWGQNRLHRSRTGGGPWEALGVALEDGTATFVETLGIQPGDPSRMYASGFFGRLHYSTNYGDECGVVMSAAGAPLLPNVGTARGDGKFAFAYAPSNGSYVYLGTIAGHVWRTTTGATTSEGWTELNSPLPIGTGRISAIAVAPNDPNSLYVGYQVAQAQVVWRGAVASSGVVQWTQASGVGSQALPAAPVNALVVDPADSHHVFAATRAGMFSSRDSGTSWQDFREGLPSVQIVDMQLRLRSRMLYVAVYGRGIFRRRI